MKIAKSYVDLIVENLALRVRNKELGKRVDEYQNALADLGAVVRDGHWVIGPTAADLHIQDATD